MKTTDIEKFTVVRSGPENFVARCTRKGQTWEEVSQHRVVLGACDCEGFVHRGTCKHVDVVNALENVPGCSEDEAFYIAAKFTEELNRYDVKLARNPLQYSQEGDWVESIHLISIRGFEIDCKRLFALEEGVIVYIWNGMKNYEQFFERT